MGISRREILKSGIATVAASGLACLAPAEESRPNMIWIVCHDIHAAMLGCYGNSLARTSAIDRFAGEGTLYKNAFTTAPVCAPSRFTLISGLYPSTCAPGHQQRSAGALPMGHKPLPVLMREAGYYCTNNVFTDYNMAVDQAGLWDEDTNKAHWRNRPAGKPFFCVYDYSITHESRAFGHMATIIDQAAVTVPPFLPDTPETRQVLARNTDMQDNMDAAFAHLMDELHEDGLDDSTIVFFVSDHGGVYPRSKRFLYEDGTNVPLIVRVPRAYQHLAGTRAGQVSEELISHVDMAPTVLTLAGVKVPPLMMGQAFMGIHRAPSREYVFSMRDRMDEICDLMYTVRGKRYRYIRNYMPQRIYGQHHAYSWQLESYQSWEREHLKGTLNKTQEAFWQQKPSEELYDVPNDPQCVKNLANAPQHRADLLKMRSVLDEFILSHNDNGLIPESASGEGYEASRVPGAYPVKQVLETANLAIERDPKNIPAFVRGLDDPNDIVRYWNAYGLVLAAPVFSPVLAAIQERMETEKVDFVRVGLAEALIASGHVEPGRDELLKIAQGESELTVQMRAANVLLGMPADQLAPVREQLVRLSSEGDFINIASQTMVIVARIDGKYNPSTPGVYNMKMPARLRGNPQRRGSTMPKIQLGGTGDPQV